MEPNNTNATQSDVITITENRPLFAKVIAVVLLLAVVFSATVFFLYYFNDTEVSETSVTLPNVPDEQVTIKFTDIGAWDYEYLRQEFVAREYLLRPHEEINFKAQPLSQYALSVEYQRLDEILRNPVSVDVARHQLYQTSARNVPLVNGQSLAAVLSSETPNLNALLAQAESELTAYVIERQRELNAAQPFMLFPNLPYAQSSFTVPGHASRPSLLAARLHMLSLLVDTLQTGTTEYVYPPTVTDILQNEMRLGNAFPSDIEAGRRVAEEFYLALTLNDTFVADFERAQGEWDELFGS